MPPYLTFTSSSHLAELTLEASEMEVAGKVALQLLNGEVGAYYEDETVTYEVEINGKKFKFQKNRNAKGVKFGDYRLDSARQNSQHLTDKDVLKMACSSMGLVPAHSKED